MFPQVLTITTRILVVSSQGFNKESKGSKYHYKAFFAGISCEQ